MRRAGKSPSYLIRTPYSYCFRLNVPTELQTLVGSHYSWKPFLYTGPSWGVFSTTVTKDSDGYHPNGSVLVRSTPRDWYQPFAFYVENSFYGIIPNDASESGFAIGTLLSGFEAGFSEASPVPIPASIWLLGSGLIGLVGYRRKFKKDRAIQD